MNVVSYMKAHRYSLVTSLLLWALVDALILASASLQRGLSDFGYLNLLLAVTFLVGNGVGWLKERGRFAPLRISIDKEQPLEGVLPAGSGYHESLLREAVELERKTWVTRLANVRNNAEELQDYIVQWTHEIKIPLSVMELIVEETQGASSQSAAADEGEHANRMRLPLERVKFLVNQVLYAGRAAHSQDDLATCDFSLQKTLRAAIRTNAPFFLAKDIAIEATPLDFSVTSDEKWIQYLFEQILHNAAKYTRPGGTVHIRASEREKGILVEIQDTGIGIPAGDLPRIFEKGFTGENGRKTEKSTGMGLYYAKRMADRLGIGLQAQSVPGEGTTFQLMFYRLGDWYSPGRM